MCAVNCWCCITTNLIGKHLLDTLNMSSRLFVRFLMQFTNYIHCLLLFLFLFYQVMQESLSYTWVWCSVRREGRMHFWKPLTELSIIHFLSYNTIHKLYTVYCSCFIPVRSRLIASRTHHVNLNYTLSFEQPVSNYWFKPLYVFDSLKKELTR